MLIKLFRNTNTIKVHLVKQNYLIQFHRIYLRKKILYYINYQIYNIFNKMFMHNNIQRF